MYASFCCVYGLLDIVGCIYSYKHKWFSFSSTCDKYIRETNEMKRNETSQSFFFLNNLVYCSIDLFNLVISFHPKS